WKPFITDVAQTVAGYAIGDRFIAFTNAGAPRGRIVAIPLDSATPNDPDTWAEVVPESAAVIRSITPVGDRFYINELIDTYARLRILDQQGELQQVPLPAQGVVADL